MSGETSASDPLSPISSLKTGETRWLLEVFELGRLSSADGPDGALCRHAVWLSRHKGTWRWWCCCGARSEFEVDPVGILTSARMHFDALHALDPSPVLHPIAAWNDRAVGQPARDDEAVRKLAEKLACSASQGTGEAE